MAERDSIDLAFQRARLSAVFGIFCGISMAIIALSIFAYTGDFFFRVLSPDMPDNVEKIRSLRLYAKQEEDLRRWKIEGGRFFAVRKRVLDEINKIRSNGETRVAAYRWDRLLSILTSNVPVSGVVSTSLMYVSNNVSGCGVNFNIQVISIDYATREFRSSTEKSMCIPSVSDGANVSSSLYKLNKEERTAFLSSIETVLMMTDEPKLNGDVDGAIKFVSERILALTSSYSYVLFVRGLSPIVALMSLVVVGAALFVSQIRHMNRISDVHVAYLVSVRSGDAPTYSEVMRSLIWPQNSKIGVPSRGGVQAETE